MQYMSYNVFSFGRIYSLEMDHQSDEESSSVVSSGRSVSPEKKNEDYLSYEYDPLDSTAGRRYFSKLSKTFSLIL